MLLYSEYSMVKTLHALITADIIQQVFDTLPYDGRIKD